MFCGRCGSELAAGARFCSACGAAVLAGQQVVQQGAPLQGSWGAEVTRLVRPRTNRAIAGVCAGLAQHYHWDLVWVRVLTVLITIFSSGAGIIAYIVFWIVMPEENWMLPATASGSNTTPPPTTSYSG